MMRKQRLRIADFKTRNGENGMGNSESKKMSFNPRSALRTPQFLALLALALLALVLPVSAAQAVIQPGEPAPLFSKKTLSGAAFNLDRKTSDTVLLIFVKPGDKFTSTALRSLERALDTFPPLVRGMRIAIVISRLDEAEQARALQKQAAPRWPLLADVDDALYHSYRIVATPTIVIVGADRTVAAVHAGYDAGLADGVRTALAKARGMKLPAAMTGPPPKPNMALQMGRRMAARGLWDDALKYYGEAAKQGPLPAVAQLELAEIQVELANADAALTLLEGLPADMKQEERAKKIMTRAQEIKAGRTSKPKPPVIQR